MTDLPMSMAVFPSELYAIYIALVFHSRVSNLIDVSTILIVRAVRQNVMQNSIPA